MRPGYVRAGALARRLVLGCHGSYPDLKFSEPIGGAPERRTYSGKQLSPVEPPEPGLVPPT